jgi:hypothetical protein
LLKIAFRCHRIVAPLRGVAWMNEVLVMANFMSSTFFGMPYSHDEKNPALGGIMCSVPVPRYGIDDQQDILGNLGDGLLRV